MRGRRFIGQLYNEKRRKETYHSRGKRRRAIPLTADHLPHFVLATNAPLRSNLLATSPTTPTNTLCATTLIMPKPMMAKPSRRNDVKDLSDGRKREERAEGR